MLNRVLIFSAGFVCLVGCSQAPTPTKEAEQKVAAPARPIGAVVEIKAPLGLPPVPIPTDNPPTAEMIALGRKLYYDGKLSVDQTISCSSCHHPLLGFGDGKSVSDGVKGGKGNRNAPVVMNSAYFTLQFWDGRAPSLEKQAEGPVANPIEMGMTHEGVVERVATDEPYKTEFAKAFGPGPVTYEMVAKAIASFERTVISGDSPFDRYQYGGDKKAMSAAAIRGLEVFKNPAKGNCAVCHTIEEKHALFMDNKFHNLGVGMNSKGDLTDLGRYAETKVEADKGAFKTPSLRNISFSAPYMHDGSHKTLKEVVDFYVGGGNSNEHLDKDIKALKLTTQERADLVAFMQALTGVIPPNIGDPKVTKAEARR